MVSSYTACHVLSVKWSLEGRSSSLGESSYLQKPCNLAWWWCSLVHSWIWTSPNCLTSGRAGVGGQDAASGGPNTTWESQLLEPVLVQHAGCWLWSGIVFPWEFCRLLLCHIWQAPPSLVQFQGKWAVCPATIPGLCKQADGQLVAVSGPWPATPLAQTENHHSSFGLSSCKHEIMGTAWLSRFLHAV